MAEEAAAAEERFKIGYALAPKKIASFIQPSLVSHAAQRGIDLVHVDPSKPILSQGPFHCLIHKLHGDHWHDQLRLFSAANPAVPVIDAPSAVDRLHNRVSMLQVVSELTLNPTKSDSPTYGVPKQIVVDEPTQVSITDVISFPVIAKPLVADGSANSHDMLLIFNQEGLKKLKKAPVVLQEFVNHGGVIFKIYVVGEHVTCVTRRSLPDISEEKMCTLGDSLSFSQISNLTATSYNTHDDFPEKASDMGNVELPPSSFVTELALGLRRALGLNLFNFDVIRDSKLGNRYLVIDINYFPGYAKMPGYEAVLTDFFWDVLHKNPNVLLDSESAQ